MDSKTVTFIDKVRKDGYCYKQFISNSDAKRFYNAIYYYHKFDEFKDYEIGVKKHYETYIVWFAKDKRVLPFFKEEDDPKEWVVRNLTVPHYRNISLLPDELSNEENLFIIKQKCEEILECEVELEVEEREIGKIIKLWQK